MNESRELSIADKEDFDSLWIPLRESCSLFFSEYSFSNNFLFRKFHDFRVISQSPLLLAGKWKNGEEYLIPTLPPLEFIALIQQKRELRHFTLFPIPDEWLSFFSDKQFEKREESSDADYICNRDSLKGMSGPHLSSRRNLLHQLERGHQIRTEILGRSTAQDAIEVLDLWQNVSTTTKEESDYFPCREALERLEELPLTGLIVYVENEPSGFVMGEVLSSKVAVCHFAKHLKFFKGIIPFLYSALAKSLPESILWINLEQDLGEASLRQAKKSFHPAFIKKKWRLTSRQE